MTHPLNQFTAASLLEEAIAQGWRTTYNEALWDWLTTNGYTQNSLNDKVYAAFVDGFDFSSFGFNPLTLFASGENGVWYDPSDFSTLYQDSVGTTPVTALGQPVGLMLDKSKGLVLGSEVFVDPTVSSLTNFVAEGVPTTLELDSNNDLHIVASANNTGAKTTISGFAPSSKTFVFEFEIYVVVGSIKLTVDYQSNKIVAVGANGGFQKKQFISAGGTTLYYVGTGSGQEFYIRNISVRELPGNHAYQATSTSRPVLWADPLTLGSELVTNGGFDDGTSWSIGPNTTITGGVATSTATPSGTNILQQAAMQPGANKMVLVSFTVSSWTGGNLRIFINNDTLTLTGANGAFSAYIFSTTSTGSGLLIRADNSAFTGSIDNISIKEVTAWNMNRYHLAFDGVDDFMQTAAIDFTASNEISIFAGASKLSDAATGVLVELSTAYSANNGSFIFTAPDNTGTGEFAIVFRGTANAAIQLTSSSYNAPFTGVFTGLGDISADNAVFRVNAVDAGTSVADQGTGNFGNYPLYIGRRGGTTLPFNGNLYSLIVRGALSDATEIANAEAYVNSKTGAY